MNGALADHLGPTGVDVLTEKIRQAGSAAVEAFVDASDDEARRNATRDVMAARDHAYDIAEALENASVPAEVQELADSVCGRLDWACRLVRTLAMDLVEKIDEAMYYSYDLTEALDRLGEIKPGPNPRDRGEDSSVTVAQRQLSHLAAGLVAAAAQMLPRQDRAGYAEEFRSELQELNRTGTGRAGQLAYALRQIRSAQALRVALQRPARRRAAP